MTAEAATLAGRAAAEALMVDTCVITDGPPVRGAFNTTTGAYATTAASTLYTGPCRVKPRDNADRTVQAGEEAVSFWPYIVSVPATVTGIDVGHLVTITASTLDPDLVDAELRVRQVLRGTHLTARRLGCEVNAG